MSGCRIALLAAALCAAPLLSVPQAQALPPGGGGGCRQGGLMTGALVAGSGSAGQNIRRSATLRECGGPLLPGIDTGQFTAIIPWNTPGAQSTAEFAWSDGSVSTATGYGNGLWLITGGRAAGHGIQVNVADTWNGWYVSFADVTVTSATFVS
ncbi:hypothetical protein [Nocardia arthritidis]|uniref:Uncharacterized protein n=1 Tax=Nocardia arthritidis TaxID=228602 RepID=A0A6G9Y8Y1_9NOCA|nr:hypothetical protein [Nocardia arthritidis]QIS09671.1 hypothetical protein F5544_08845 [Nocardia arthritidis]